MPNSEQSIKVGFINAFMITIELIVRDMNPTKAETCNRVLTENNGLILSPGYPEAYPTSLDCSFKIVVEESTLKLALFFTKFELESSANCANDYLQIDSQPKLCGKELPDPYFKNSNQIDIRFHSNDNLGGNIYQA